MKSYCCSNPLSPSLRVGVTPAGHAASPEPQATQGSEPLRLSTGPCYGQAAGASGSGGAQARPRAGSGGAGPDRGAKLREPTRGRQLEGGKQTDSDNGARAVYDARAARQWREETRPGERLTRR